MKFSCLSMFCACMLFAAAPVFADVQVDDKSTSADTSNTQPAQELWAPEKSSAAEKKVSTTSKASVIEDNTANLTLEQRVARLEQQMRNFKQMNFQTHMDDLQQQIQKLNGEIEVQNHDIQDLKNDVHNFYTDLDQRINKNKTEASNTKASTTTTDAAAPSKTDITSDNTKEQKTYQAALDLLQSQKFAEGAKKLKSYLKNYPNGTFAPNAHYWLGEVYFTDQNFKQAETEFMLVTTKYKTFKKVPDAMLKLGMIYEKSGNHVKAQNEFRTLKKRFPKSDAAKLANAQTKTN